MADAVRLVRLEMSEIAGLTIRALAALSLVWSALAREGGATLLYGRPDALRRLALRARVHHLVALA